MFSTIMYLDKNASSASRFPFIAVRLKGCLFPLSIHRQNVRRYSLFAVLPQTGMVVETGSVKVGNMTPNVLIKEGKLGHTL